MTDMVERVARSVMLYVDAPPSKAEYWRTVARIAIAAMREPTDAMENAAYDQFEWGPPMAGPLDDALPHNVWRAMIDAALKLPAQTG